MTAIEVPKLKDLMNRLFNRELFQEVHWHPGIGYDIKPVGVDTLDIDNIDELDRDIKTLMNAFLRRAEQLNKGNLPGAKFWNNPNVDSLFDDLFEVISFKIKYDM